MAEPEDMYIKHYSRSHEVLELAANTGNQKGRSKNIGAPVKAFLKFIILLLRRVQPRKFSLYGVKHA